MGEHQFAHLQESERFGTWCVSNNGNKYWPLDLRPEDVHIIDISNALGNICRYGGHVDRFWSVAQHSWLISHLVEENCAKDEEEFWLLPMKGLMHDAHETYIGDIIRPIKKYLFKMCPELLRVVERADRAICTKFNIPGELCPPVIQHLDEVLLESETLLVRPSAPLNYSTHGEGYQEQRLEPARDWKNWRPWAPELAGKMFLERFRELDARRQAA